MFQDEIGYSISATYPSTALLEQVLELGQERFHVLKIAVNRGKPDICNLIERNQPAHEQLAYFGGRHFAIRRLGKLRSDGIHYLGQLGHGHRPLFAGLEEPFKHLLAIEFFAPSISFDDHIGDFVTTLVGGEAALTLQALTAA